ncbi:MAG TPA: hypothetical protein VHO29_13870 [Marmoricola sp.]|nr:hypothetical protein [Marmoricola sp.]
MPFAGSDASGDQIVAASRDRTVASIELLDLKAHRVVRTIATLPSSGAQATGSFDGHYAVWKEIDSPGDTDTFTIKVWNSVTDRVAVVGGSHKLPDGTAAPSTWEDPVIAAGRAAWIEGTDASGAGDLVLLDLVNGKRRMFHHGHPGWLALTPSLVIWAESSRPGADTSMMAADVVTGAAATVPEPLTGVRGAWGFVTDGNYWSWVAGDPATLYGGRVGGAPRAIAAVPQGGGSPPVAVAAGIASVPVSAGGLLLANVGTGGWTYNPRASWATNLSSALLVNKTTKKGGPDQSSMARVGPTAAAALAC